jgi:hypothetical protein
LVRRWIINNAEDPKEVEFVKWGPHMSGQEWEDMLKEAGVSHLPRGPLDRFDAMIRVTYRKPMSFSFAEENPRQKVLHDHVFVVQGKIVILSPLSFFLAGDDWKKNFRKEMARMFPGIDVEK